MKEIIVCRGAEVHVHSEFMMFYCRSYEDVSWIAVFAAPSDPPPQLHIATLEGHSSTPSMAPLFRLYGQSSLKQVCVIYSSFCPLKERPTTRVAAKVRIFLASISKSPCVAFVTYWPPLYEGFIKSAHLHEVPLTLLRTVYMCIPRAFSSLNLVSASCVNIARNSFSKFSLL